MQTNYRCYSPYCKNFIYIIRGYSKVFFGMFLILFTATLFGQRNLSKKILVNGMSTFHGAFIFFPLLNDTIQIKPSTQLSFDTTDSKRKLFYCCINDEKSRIYNLDIDKILDSTIDFKIPDKSFFDNLYKSKICPLCQRKDSVIFFVYGKPNSNLLRLSKKGEIKLAGCNLSNTSPKMFCKKDDLEF